MCFKGFYNHIHITIQVGTMEYSTLLIAGSIFPQHYVPFWSGNPLRQGELISLALQKTLQKTESAWKGLVLAEDLHQTATNVWCLWKADMNQIFNVWIVQVTKKTRYLHF